MNTIDLRLETLDGGGALELFHRELDKVLENVEDPNTNAKQERRVTLVLRIKPSEARDQATVFVEVGSRLASVKPVGGLAYLGRRGGKVVAVMHDPQQANLFDAGQPADVLPLTKKGQP